MFVGSWDTRVKRVCPWRCDGDAVVDSDRYQRRRRSVPRRRYRPKPLYRRCTTDTTDTTTTTTTVYRKILLQTQISPTPLPKTSQHHQLLPRRNPLLHYILPFYTPPHLLPWTGPYLLRRHRAHLNPCTVQFKFNVASSCDVPTGVSGFVEGVGEEG